MFIYNVGFAQAHPDHGFSTVIILSECDGACQSQYSGRCTGSMSDDCCPVFDGGVCADNCAANFAPDIDDCYQCGKMMICKN